MNLDEMLARYRDMKAEFQPILDELTSLERGIKSHVLETGEMGNVDGVRVSIRNGYTRHSWDNKKLQGYAVAHPELLDFCKVTSVGPSVSIKLE